MTRASLIDQRRAVLTARRRGGAGSIGDDPFLTLVIEIRAFGLTIRPVSFRDVGDLMIGVGFGGMSPIRRPELWATKRGVLTSGEGRVPGRPSGFRGESGKVRCRLFAAVNRTIDE